MRKFSGAVTIGSHHILMRIAHADVDLAYLIAEETVELGQESSLVLI